MWHRLFVASKADPGFTASAVQLLQTTARNLILAAAGLSAVVLVIRWFGQPNDVDRVALPLLFGGILVSIFALWLLPRAFTAALIIWQISLAALLLLAILLLHEPLLAFIFAFFPLLTIVTLGWPAAVVAVVIIGGLVWGLTWGMLPAIYGWGIAMGALISGALGWAVTRALYTVTEWSIFSFLKADAQLEEARNQRVEFKQTQEDLLQANRELARLSDRLKAMYQVAEEARHMKEEFVANVSHELRTPLNMIIGFSDMIIHAPEVYGSALSPALMADITAIQRNSQHLSRLVDDVLDLSQVEAGKMVLVKESAALTEIVDAAALAVRALYDSKGLYLHATIPDNLPLLFCDSTRIRQVILNLLSNAGRFTEKGGVEVKAQRDGNSILVSVSDTGPGIAPENQAKLFQPFQQLDGSLRRTHGGTGLGLSISKRFIEMHEGKMWLESPGQACAAGGGGPGSTFYFTIPIGAPVTAAAGGASAALRWLNPYQPYEARNRGSKVPIAAPAPRFILLDQGDSLLRRLRQLLTGAEILAVRDLASAQHELSRSPARALLVNTPALSETSVCLEQLRDLPYQTPVIAFWSPTEDETARRLGVVRYLVKPITRDALLQALAALGTPVESVLLVDDEPDIVRLLSRHIASADRGYRVTRATDGQRALDLLRERHPDVMLLDLILPGVDGFQVLREKREDPAIRDIPVIVISSKDPVGQPIVSDTLTVCRSGGLSMRDLAACVDALSGVLTPSASQGGPAVPENQDG